jgi:hypothetical protein
VAMDSEISILINAVHPVLPEATATRVHEIRRQGGSSCIDHTATKSETNNPGVSQSPALLIS